LRLLLIAVLGVLAVVAGRGPTPVGAAPDAGITVSVTSNPVAESDDYATQILGDPWDMNNPDDADWLNHMTRPTYTNGIFSANSTAQDSSIFLQYQGWDTAADYLGERSGPNYPIPQGRYSHLRFRMYSSVADQMVVFWFKTHNWTGQPNGQSDIVPTQAGWHIYDIDLNARANVGTGNFGADSWNGLVLNPTWYQGHSNVNIQLDWVRLTPASGPNATINWSGSSSPVSLYVTLGGGDEFRIAANLPGSGSYTWAAGAALAPGTYTIHAVSSSGSGTSNPLTINNAPVLNITAPSPSSGEDYATTNLGYSWNLTTMTSLQPVIQLAGGLFSYSFQPGFLLATAGGDPNLNFLYNDGVHSIDTHRYHYFSYNLYLGAPNPDQAPGGQYSQWNAGPRLLWALDPRVPSSYKATETQIQWYNRWQQVALDLNTYPTDPNYSGPSWAAAGHVSVFRFDPQEEDRAAGSQIYPAFFQLNGVRLTADPRVSPGGKTTISWTPGKTAGNVTIQYNNGQGTSGTAGTATLASGGFVWQVPANLPQSRYTISVVANDGLNTFSQVARAPLLINCATGCGQQYTDTPPANPFYTFISNLTARGVVEGFGDNTFQPYTNATRALLAKWVVLARGLPINAAGGPHFVDVPTTDPFYPYIETAANAGFISGYSDHTFRPYNTVTRGQMAKIVVQGLGLQINTAGGPHFRDVDRANPFYAEIETIYNRGLVSGYADGTFRWGNNNSRGQLTKVLSNAISR
jgi:hypothetical protein